MVPLVECQVVVPLRDEGVVSRPPVRKQLSIDASILMAFCDDFGQGTDMGEDWRIRRVSDISALIKEAEPDVIEERKWRKPSNPDGVPAFSLDGLICVVETLKAKVKINFHRGASISDPDGLFNASLEAPMGRAIDLYEGDVLNEEQFKRLIQRAVQVNRTR